MRWIVCLLENSDLDEAEDPCVEFEGFVPVVHQVTS